MLDPVQQLFYKYANPLFGTLYASGVAIEEFNTKKKSTSALAFNSASDFSSSQSQNTQLVFSAMAIAELSKMNLNIFNTGAYGSAGLYNSNGVFSSSSMDYTSIFQAVA